MTPTDLFDVSGRTVIVTGASSGLGVHVAEAFAAAKANVVITARREDRLAGVERDLVSGGAEAMAVVADASDPEAADRVVATTVERFGRVDILVNNAGIAAAVPALRERPEDFRRVVDVNLHGTYWMSQAAARVMQPGSVIINISSVLGLTSLGLPQAAYASSKAAVLGLTRDLAQQWTGRKGIRVVALAPGFFRTEMTDEYPDGYLDSMMARVPMGRTGDPRELAATTVFLASDAAGYITGTTLTIDGGLVNG